MFKFCIYSSNNNANLVGSVLSKRGNWEQVERTEDNQTEIFTICNFIWKPTNLSTAGYNKLDQAARSRPKEFIQVFNHFENLYGLCTKTGLIRSLRKYYNSTKEAKQIKYNVYDSTPTSFLVSPNLNEYEYSLFAGRFQELAKQDFSREILPQKHCLRNFWLVKPADQNQGRGIQVFNKLHEIEEFLTSRTNQSFWVIQKYLERPLLYYGRKFDIRMWAFVTAKNEIFLYKKGYLRTSSEGFDLKNSNNYVHLTNNCLQKHGGNYGQHEEGNTLPLEILDNYFAETYPDLKLTVESHIMPKIRDLVIDTILATKRDLNPLNRKNGFEFLGYDFMIDEDMRTWLIEANTNPYIGVPTEYIGGLLNIMLDDLLKIVVDPLLPPQETADASRPNGFELLYCENGSTHNNGPMNLRTPFSKNVYPAQELVPADITQKLLILEKGPEPAQHPGKLKESKSSKALKAKENREKMKDVKLKEKIEKEEENKVTEKGESNLIKHTRLARHMQQIKEEKQRDNAIQANKKSRDRNPKRDRSSKTERELSEDLSADKDRSRFSQSKEVVSSRNKSSGKVVNIKEDRKVNESSQGELKDEQQYPFINEVANLMKDKDKEKDLNKSTEKIRRKNTYKQKSMKLPFKGLGTLYGHNPRKNQADQQQKTIDPQTPQDYLLDVELFNPAQLEIEGIEIKTCREENLPIIQQTIDKAVKVELGKKLDVEELHKDLHLALVYKTNHNSEYFTKKVSSVLECLSDCEIFTEKQSQTACRILSFIAQSDARGMLAQQFAVNALVKILRSPNAGQTMKCHIIDIFYLLAKIPGLKAKLLSTSLVSDVIKIYLSDLPQQSGIAQNGQFLILTIYFLLTLGKVFNRRAFITDAFTELHSARYSFICQGGVLALWFLVRKSNDQELKSFAYKNFFDYVSFEDLEQQCFLVTNLSKNHGNKFHTEPLKKSATLSQVPFDRETLFEEDKSTNILPMIQQPQNQGDKSRREAVCKNEARCEEARNEDLNIKKETENAFNLFKAFSEVFNSEHLIEEFKGYIDFRKQGQFGFEDEDKERRKYLSSMVEDLKADEENINQEETEEIGDKNKKTIADRIEKKVENALQKYQLEVNCRQKEIKELLKEKEIEEKKRHTRSLLQQRAEVMRRRNKLEIKKKELQKLAFKVNVEEKKDQFSPRDHSPFELNVQKATWGALKSYGSQKGKDCNDETNALKPQLNRVVDNSANKFKAKHGSVVLENVPSTVKSNDKVSSIQTDNTWVLETNRGKQFGGILAIDSRRGSTNVVEDSPFARVSPWRSAKGALNEFLQAQNKASLSPKSKNIRSNFTEIQTFSKKNHPIDAVDSKMIDDFEGGEPAPEISYRKSQLLKENPKLPPVVSKQGLSTLTLGFDEKLIKPGGLKSYSMLFDNKLKTNPKGQISLGKEANKFF